MDYLRELDQDPIWTWPHARRWDDEYGIGTIGPTKRFGNVVFRFRPLADHLEKYWQQTMDRYHGIKPDFHVGPLEPDFLPGFLKSKNYHLSETHIILVKDLLPPQWKTPSVVSISPALTLAAWEGFHQLEQRVFRFPPTNALTIQSEVAESNQTNPSTRLFVAWHENLVIGAAGMTIHRNHAGMWGGQTDPQWRNRGIYRSLTAAREEYAHQRGLAWTVVEAKETTSYPLLVRWGYREIGQRLVFKPGVSD